MLVPAVARKPSICDRMLLVCSAGIFTFRIIGDDAGEIDGVAVDDDLAQPCPNIDAIDGQRNLPLDWYYSYTQLVEPLS